MRGALLLNSKQQICLVDFDRTDTVAAFRYVADVRMLVVIHVDGSEHLFTSEIAPELHHSLRCSSDLLVVHLDEGNPRRAAAERMTPLTVVA